MVAGRHSGVGDLFFNKYCPRIDPSANGSVFPWADILVAVMNMCFEYGC